MKLGKDIDILEGLPILYIKSLNALVCSDLHLGFEGVMASKGIFIPKANLKKIKSEIVKARKMRMPDTIIIDGDIKNEFSNVHVEEFNEFDEFVKFLKSIGFKRIVLIKGNHDNFIDRYRSSTGIEIAKQEMKIGKYLFFHGEKMPEENLKEVKTWIMGHVHPAIAVYNKVGVKEKLFCFLVGKLGKGRELIILPAMNFFAGGVEVNMNRVRDISPIFKLADVNDMRALCIGEGETLDFGKVGKLRYK